MLSSSPKLVKAAASHSTFGGTDAGDWHYCQISVRGSTYDADRDSLDVVHTVRHFDWQATVGLDGGMSEVGVDPLRFNSAHRKPEYGSVQNRANDLLGVVIRSI